MTLDGWVNLPFAVAAHVNPSRRLRQGATAPFVPMAAVQSNSPNVAFFELKVFSGGGAKFQRGDTLLARITPCAENGKTAVIAELPGGAEVGFGSTELTVLAPRKGLTLQNYIYCLVKAPGIRNLLIGRMVGSSGRQRIPNDAFDEVIVGIPPLPEQQKIAAILSALDEVIEKTGAVIASLQTLKTALLQELLTRGLPGRHTRFKPSEIGMIPETWETVRCDELFHVQLGKMISPRSRGGAAQFPYLRNQNVYWDRFDLTDVATMSFDERERQKFKLKPGDLLACEGRHIGRCAVWDGAIDECYYQKALHRLRAKSDRITTQYMQHFMTLRFRHQDDLVSHVRTSTTIPHLPREQLLALTVVVPPRAEQDEITEQLAMLRAREHAEEANLDALCTAKDALASVLLTGELRVPADQEIA